MNCIKCGAEIGDTSFYCTKCRNALDTESNKAAAKTAKQNVKMLIDEAKDEMQLTGIDGNIELSDSSPKLNGQLSKIRLKLYLQIAACVVCLFVFLLLCVILQFRGGLIYTAVFVFLEGYFIYRIKQSIRYSSLINKSINEMKRKTKAADMKAAMQ